MRENVENSLHSKRLTATAGAGCVGIIELETLSVQSIAEIELGSDKVQEAFFIADNAYALVFKHLIVRLELVIELQHIAEA